MKPKPRVLLLSASSGAGHFRAAQASEKALGAANLAADIAEDAQALVN